MSRSYDGIVAGDIFVAVRKPHFKGSARALFPNAHLKTKCSKGSRDRVFKEKRPVFHGQLISPREILTSGIPSPLPANQRARNKTH